MKKIFSAVVFLALAAGLAFGASLTIIHPNGGEKLLIGATYQIQWQAVDINENVKLFLYKGTVKLGLIAQGLSVTPSAYAWKVGEYDGGTAAPGGDYKVRIRTMSNGPDDFSDAFFSLDSLNTSMIHNLKTDIKPGYSPKPASSSITVVSPQANLQYTAGQPLPVVWDKNFGFNTDIHLYLMDDQGSELEHVFPVANTGSYNGFIPGVQYTWPGRKFQIELAALNPSNNSVLKGTSGFFQITAPPPQQKVTRTLARNGQTSTTHTRQYQDEGMPECLSASHPAPGRDPGAREIKVGQHVVSGRHKECDWYEAYYFRGHVSFDLDEVKGKEILEAKLLVSLSGFQQLNPQGDLATNEECDSNCDVYIEGPGYTGGILTSFSIFTQGEKQSLDVTKAVQYWAAGNPNQGLLFRSKLDHSKYANSICLKYYATMFLTVKYVDYK